MADLGIGTKEQKLTIEATYLSDQIWFEKMKIEKNLLQEQDDSKLVDLIALYARLGNIEEKALERMARRLAKQVNTASQ